MRGRWRPPGDKAGNRLALPRTLLLDLDGTLVAARGRIHPLFIARAARILRSEGLGWLGALRALHALRKGAESTGGGRSNAARAAARLADAVGWDSARADETARRIVREVFSSLGGEFSPVVGAREFVDWARPRFELVLATNPVWPLEFIEMRMRRGGLDPGVFGFVSHADGMTATKPSLNYYRELLSKLGRQAAECLMIGDSTRKDLPAREIGIPVFLIGRGPGTRRLGEGYWAGDFPALRRELELAW